MNDNFVILPFRRRPSQILAGFILDELTDVIGFAQGSLILYRAGYCLIRDVYTASPADIRAIPHIGPKKLASLDRYFEANDLKLPVPFSPAAARQGRLALSTDLARVSHQIAPGLT